MNEARIEAKFLGKTEVRVNLSLHVLAGGGGVASTIGVKRVALVLPSLKAKRQKFDEKKKIEILDVAKKSGVSNALSIARNTPGYEKLSRPQLVKWRKRLNVQRRTAGRRPPGDDFYREVLSHLILGSIDKADTAARYKIVANVAYGFDIIRKAAQEARKLPQFAKDTKLQERSPPPPGTCFLYNF